MTRLALFGAGRIGQVHARNLMTMPDMKLVAIADPVASPAREDLLMRSQARLDDAESIFSDPDIDAYLIASPTDTHASLLRRAAGTGKPVFCEKPISLDFRQVVDVAEAFSRTNTRIMLGFQRRYDPDFMQVREEIRSGRSGKVQHIVMHTRDPSPPPVSYVKSSGGLFRDQAIHDFDMTRYLLGEEITSVFATGNCLIAPEIGEAGDIDTAMMTLRSESGSLVQMINARYAAFGYDQRLEAVCAERVFYVANHPAHHLVSADARGFTSSGPMSDFIARFAQAYRAEMEAFRDMIVQGRPPLATLCDGVEAQRLAEAAALSLQTGRPVDVASVR